MHYVIAVDDTQTNILIYRQILKENPDIHVISFEDPQEAITWLTAPATENPADLILLDYMMPDLNGLDFIALLHTHKHRRDVPIVMVTADTERAVRLQALQLGARDFLTKPVDKAELISRVNNLLVLRKQSQQLADRANWLTSEVKKATAEIRMREREAILRLSLAAEYRDPETGNHLKRMARYSELIARGLGLPESECELVLEAAPMHDIGKVGIPDRILLKPGKLTDDEYMQMQRHAEIGYQILAGSGSPLIRTAAIIAYTHHEKWNGSGYPRGMKETEIPLYGRIIAVADVFDALTSIRPYKKSWTIDEATALLRREADAHFDPNCVKALLEQLPEAVAIKQRYQDETTAD